MSDLKKNEARFSQNRNDIFESAVEYNGRTMTILEMLIYIRECDMILDAYAEACNELRKRFVDFADDGDIGFIENVASGVTEQKADWEPEASAQEQIDDFKEWLNG